MRWFLSLTTLNLIDVLNYYLTLALLIGTVIRIRFLEGQSRTLPGR